MSPPTDGGPGAAAAPEVTLLDRMLEGEFGLLVPAGGARARLAMTDEALRRFGDEVEVLLGCGLPTGSGGARLYPEQLLGLMAQARTLRESGRARSRKAALEGLLATRGWIASAEDAPATDLTAFGELVADLRAVSWRLTEVAPQLGGVIDEHRDVMGALYDALNRVTLELPQIAPHLERIRLANETVTTSAHDLRRRTDHLAAVTVDLDARLAARHREDRSSKTPRLSGVWPVGVVAAVGGLIGGILAHLLGS